MRKLVSKLGYAGATATTLLWTSLAYAECTPGGDCKLPLADSVSVLEIIQNVVNFLLLIAGGLAIVFLIYAGIMYIVGGAKGDADAKKMIINALTGVIVIVLSYVLVNAVIGLITKGTA